MSNIIRQVQLTGGPPWGFRYAFTSTVATTNYNGDAGPGNVIVGGIKIARVNPGSKASNAGLRDGDLILTVNGENVNVIQEGHHQPERPSGSGGGGNVATSQQGSVSGDANVHQHQKIIHQLQGDTIRLGVLSKKSKKSHNKEKSSSKKNTLRWADNSDNNTESNSNTTEVKEVKDNEDNELFINEERKDNQNQDTLSSSPLLYDIIQELELMDSAATTAANLLKQMGVEFTKDEPVSENKQSGLLVSAEMNHSLLIKQEDLSKQISQHEESQEQKEESDEILPVWTPPSIQPSPKQSRKTFRPVNFNADIISTSNSSTPSNPIMQSPSSPSTNCAITEFNNDQNRRHLLVSSLQTQLHEPATSQIFQPSQITTSSNLPRYQSPTVVLLQKAREGQLPKGAHYLEADDVKSSSLNYNGSSRSTTEDQAFMINPPLVNQSRSILHKNRSASNNEIINIPLTSKSALSGEKEQREWYKKMYDSLHVEKNTSPTKKCTYPAGRVKASPPAKSFWAKKIHSNGTVSEPEDDLYYGQEDEEEELDFNKFGNTVLSPVSPGQSGRRIPPGAIRFNNPGRIEDYNPGGSSTTSVAKKQRYFRQMQPDMKKHWALQSSPISSSGYESDSNYIMRKRISTDTSGGIKSPAAEEQPPPISPAEQRHLYVEIQKGGEVPFQGLRKFVGPKDHQRYLTDDINIDDSLDGFRTCSPSQQIRYAESTVNIHYRAPVRLEEKQFVTEEDLRKKQELAMKKFYEEQRKVKYLRELEDMERRRHSDNFVPSQKSPIPLNRFEDEEDHDGLFDNTPPRPNSGSLWQRMTPEPPYARGKQTALLARVLYNFAAQSPREIQLVKGDLVLIRKKLDANWYEGERKSSNSGSSALGIFPCSYVQILPEDSKSQAIKPIRASDFEGSARVLYNFHPSSNQELELVKGEIMILSRRVDQNWFEGRKQKKPHLKGIFPVSYVDVIKEIGSSKSPNIKKPVGQPVAHSLNYSTDPNDPTTRKHHYKPNEFMLHGGQDESDYGEVSSNHNQNDRNARNRRRMNQRLELITIDTRLNNDERPAKYRSIYNYKPVHTDELELAEDDIIHVLEKCDDGWFVGTSLRTGLFGTFPGNYVERI